MAHDTRWLRESSRLVSTLLQTREEDLERFRERLPDKDKPSPAELHDARQLLLHLVSALTESSSARWQGVRRARQMLDEWDSSAQPASSAPASGAPAITAGSRVDATAPPSETPRMARAPVRVSSSPWAPSGGDPAAVYPPVAVTPIAAPSTHAPTTAIKAVEPVEALPFQGRIGVPSSSVPLEPHPAFGLTAPAPTAAATTPPLPFGASPTSIPGARLDLEHYACFCAENAIWPRHRAQILARYALDEASARDIERRYRQAFLGNDRLEQRFNQLVAEYRRRLS